MVAPPSELDATGHGNTSAQRRWMHVTQSVLAGKDIMKTFQKVKYVCVYVCRLICLKLVARVEESDGKANYFLQRELHCTRHLKGHQVETESQGNCFSCSLVVSCLLEEAV